MDVVIKCFKHLVCKFKKQIQTRKSFLSGVWGDVKRDNLNIFLL